MEVADILLSTRVGKVKKLKRFYSDGKVINLTNILQRQLYNNLIVSIITCLTGSYLQPTVLAQKS